MVADSYSSTICISSFFPLTFIRIHGLSANYVTGLAFKICIKTNTPIHIPYNREYRQEICFRSVFHEIFKTIFCFHEIKSYQIKSKHSEMMFYLDSMVLEG